VPTWAYARAGQRVVLQAQLQPEVKGARFSWFQLEPTKPYVDNTSPTFHFEPIGYAAVERLDCRMSRTCDASAEAQRYSGYSKVPRTGVMAYQVRATLPDGTVVETPGPTAGTGFGLPREVLRVVFRRDDSYLGYLTELFNTPYIFGSSSDGRRHQTDDLIGSDCADLAVYGARRMGLPVEYTSSYAIERVAPVVAVQSSADERVQYGEGARKIREGDLLRFPNSRHIAVLYEDREPKGVLDTNDLMLHTCWAPPTVERLDASRCFSYPIRVLRFSSAPKT
jgi:hypothetical protein